MGVMYPYGLGGDDGFTSYVHPQAPRVGDLTDGQLFTCQSNLNRALTQEARKRHQRVGAEREEKGRVRSEFGRLSRSERKEFPKAIL